MCGIDLDRKPGREKNRNRFEKRSVNESNLLRILKMASDVEAGAFEMKCTFEMKHKDPRRKDWDCKRISETEYGKKGCKNQFSLELRNESDCVSMSVDYKKMNEQHGSVNDEEKIMLVVVNESHDKAFVDAMEVMTAQVGSSVAKNEMTI